MYNIIERERERWITQPKERERGEIEQHKQHIDFIVYNDPGWGLRVGFWLVIMIIIGGLFSFWSTTRAWAWVRVIGVSEDTWSRRFWLINITKRWIQTIRVHYFHHWHLNGGETNIFAVLYESMETLFDIIWSGVTCIYIYIYTYLRITFITAIAALRIGIQSISLSTLQFTIT